MSRLKAGTTFFGSGKFYTWIACRGPREVGRERGSGGAREGEMAMRLMLLAVGRVHGVS